MSTNGNGSAVALRPVATPDRIGQATAVEQSRAVAEVQAQVIVAQRMPRNVERAEREILRSCAHRTVAEKAFYRFPRAGGQVSGESIVLARELARCWGNIDYGIAELRRDDLAGESEMMAYAWDLETNTRPRTTFIVPHIRDKKGGPERLTDARDVYENNANMGARRVREMILNILPPWFIEEAKAACYATLAADDSDGKTTGERAAKAVERFGRIGVSAAQLIQKLGAPQSAWSPADLAQLTVIFRSIERGETTKDDEFGAAADRITPADIAGPKDASPAQAVPPSAEPPNGSPRNQAGAGEAPDRPPALIASGQKNALDRERQRLGYGDSEQDWDDWLADLARLAGIAAIAAPAELTQAEAKRVLDQLKPVKTAAALRKLLDTGEIAAGEPDGE